MQKFFGNLGNSLATIMPKRTKRFIVFDRQIKRAPFRLGWLGVKISFHLLVVVKLNFSLMQNRCIVILKIICHIGVEFRSFFSNQNLFAQKAFAILIRSPDRHGIDLFHPQIILLMLLKTIQNVPSGSHINHFLVYIVIRIHVHSVSPIPY